MEERLLTIVKAMARGFICHDDCFSECLQCGVSDYDNAPDFSEIRHKPDCPVLLARTVLKEQDAPLSVYHVTYEVQTAGSRRASQPWRPVSLHTLAFTEEEATQEYIRNGTRGTQAEFVRALG